MIQKILLLIIASLSFITLSYESTHAALGCSFSWTQNCNDPKKIEVGCVGDDCSIAGGYSGVTRAVDGTFTEKTITEFVIDTVLYFLGFVTLVAVIYVLYAGFQIMTGAGDEDKIKKARQTISYVLIGIVVMWAAYWVVTIILEALN